MGCFTVIKTVTGMLDEETEGKMKVCPNCGCMFIFSEDEVLFDSFDGEYIVNCPECDKRLKTKW